MGGHGENARVRQQYERWVYPAPIDDVASYVAAGQTLHLDPAHDYHRFWPHRARRPLSILVAGCGSFQAAVIAFNNPESKVLGIDVSEASLARTAALQQRAGLSNLSLRAMSLLDVERLRQRFDLVLCTGVLHHLPDPAAGARALGSVLAPDGVIGAMVYGSTLRAGVYMLQRAFRAARLGQGDSDVAAVRRVLASLPPHHAARAYLAAAPELADDAAIVDTFLHPQDTAFDVDGVYALAEAAGLGFAGWLDPRHYVPEHLMVPELCAALGTDTMDERARAMLAESFGQVLACHFFLLVHPESERPVLDFAGDDWLGYVPVPRRTLTVQPAADGTGLSIARLGETRPASRAKALLAAAADGRRTVLECILAVALADRQGGDTALFEARRAFGELYRDGHVLLLTGEAAAQARIGSPIVAEPADA